MRVQVNNFALAATLGALIVSFGLEASAGGSGQEGADRFVPSLAVTSGVYVQVWDAAFASEICRSCSFPDPASTPFRPSDQDSTLDVTPYVHGVFELMTPEFSLPGSPRLFVGGEFGGSFGIERLVAREGDPSQVGSPLPPGGEGTGFEEDTATGQGTALIGVRDTLTFGAHAGLALPFEFLGRPVRLRTSVGWVRYGIEVSGTLQDAECTPAGSSTQCSPEAASDGYLRAVSLNVTETAQFDGIGPGLELEMDTGRFGPVGSSIHVGARAYRILGDRDVSFRTTTLVTDDSLGRDEQFARYSFEVDEWLYRVGIGFRLSWLGNRP